MFYLVFQLVAVVTRHRNASHLIVPTLDTVATADTERGAAVVSALTALQATTAVKEHDPQQQQQ